jgi:hypothetical protein
VTFPQAGDELETEEAWHEFAAMFSLQEGFLVVMKRCKMKGGQVVKRDIRCHHEGNPKVPDSKKTGCKWLIRIKRDPSSGKWAVLPESKNTHNHVLLPQDAPFPSYRVIPKEAREHILRMDMLGTKVKDMVKELPTLVPGMNVVVNGEMIRKFLLSDARNKPQLPQAEQLREYFKQYAKDDKHFKRKFLVEAGVMKGAAWMTGEQQALWRKYGDVVVFDATYKTNMLRMPLSLFVGMDGRGRSVILACALTHDEKTSTFGWLFDTILEFTGNRAPQILITDQDDAMASACATVFTATQHRLCAWHLAKNFVKNMAKRQQGMEAYSGAVLPSPGTRPPGWEAPPPRPASCAR